MKLKYGFVKVMLRGAEAITAGQDHSIVLKQGGSVWATGNNNFGQLGDASRILKSTFVRVISGGVQVVSAGNWHSMVLKRDGSVWATGTNGYGQLGDGSTVGKPRFVRVVLPQDGACCAVSTICSSYFPEFCLIKCRFLSHLRANHKRFS